MVAQQTAGGGWREIAGRFTLEFRAFAARPHTKIKREFTVPVDSPDRKLRIAVRGVGQVAISHVALTDGVETRRAGGFRHKRILGRRAPKQCLPNLNEQPGSEMAMLSFG